MDGAPKINSWRNRQVDKMSEQPESDDDDIQVVEEIPKKRSKLVNDCPADLVVLDVGADGDGKQTDKTGSDDDDELIILNENVTDKPQFSEDHYKVKRISVYGTTAPAIFFWYFSFP